MPLDPQELAMEEMRRRFSAGGDLARTPGAPELALQWQEKLDALHAERDKRPDQATQYGGSPEAQAAELQRMGGLANGYQQGFLGSMQDRMGTRGYQTDALQLMRDAAYGNAPSVAAIQQRQGLDTALRNQQAMASGARGAAGLATANYGAAQNAGAMQQQGVNDSSMLRAQEMTAARGAYGQYGLGMGAQDLQSAGIYGNLGLGYEGLGQAARLHSMDANQRYLEMLAGQQAATARLEEEKRQNQVNTAIGIGTGVAGAVGGGVTAGVMAGKNKPPGPTSINPTNDPNNPGY